MTIYFGQNNLVKQKVQEISEKLEWIFIIYFLYIWILLLYNKWQEKE